MGTTQKEKLTAPRIAKATCPAGMAQCFIWDTALQGLALRVSAQGRKTFIYQSRLAGKSLRLTIGLAGTYAGTTGTYTIDEARKEATRLQAEIDSGHDPRIIKAERTATDAAKREKAKQEETPALEAWGVYVQARTPKWSERHKADHDTMSREGGEIITRGRRQGMAEKKEKGILRPLLELPLNQITRDRVAAWLEVEAPKRPTRTRLAVSLLATFINWCTDRPEYREQVNADACVRMKKDLPKPAAKDDVLQREQLALWFEHVKRIRNPIQAAYLQTALLIGARREEVAAMRWEDIDFKWLSITIRDKVEGERTIPLTPYVKSLLLDLKRLNDSPTVVNINGEKPEPSPWVFSSPTAKNGYITEPRIAHNRAIQSAGLPHLTIHGLRRSFSTLAEWVECPAGVAAQIQGHKPSATAEKHYKRRPLDLLRMWHTKIEKWILEQAGIEQPQAVQQTVQQPAPLRVVGGLKHGR